MEQSELLTKSASYRMYKYAVLVSHTDKSTGKTEWYVKDGDTRKNSMEEALAYAASETTGKTRGLMEEDDVLGVWDMTSDALKRGRDPSDTDASLHYDNDIRHLMPLKHREFRNFMGQKSLELHPIDSEYIANDSNWFEQLAYEWDAAHKRILNGGDPPPKKRYIARPYLIDAFNKMAHDTKGRFLLAAATGAGKETSSLASVIYIHDTKGYNTARVNLVVATIPSTTSEIFNELATVSGMEVGDYGFVDYSRIVPYVTSQWFKDYLKTCSPAAKVFIRENAIVIKKVSDIPTRHKKGQVPVLFGSYHDIARQSGDDLVKSKYRGLDKRIGALVIGEAHQMLSNNDNTMWKNINSSFGKNCFKFFVTGTPYDFIYGNVAAEHFAPEQRAMFTRNDLYRDKNNNPDSHFKKYPDFNYYGLNVQSIVEELRKDSRFESEEDGFTWTKLFEWDKAAHDFKYVEPILNVFRRFFSLTAFSESGDPLSVWNAPNLSDVSKQHGIVALPIGNKKAPAKVRIARLKELLIDNNIFPGTVFDAYEDTLGDRKDDIANSKGKTLTLTCIKDCTGANIPEWGYFIFMRNIGDSVKFFEQATGRVGRAYEGKDSAGVFLADLENTMDLMVTIEEKIALEKDESLSTNHIIHELLDNYNYFTGTGGEWSEIDPIDFAAKLEELNSKGTYGIGMCVKESDMVDGIDFIVKKLHLSQSETVELTTNGTEAKNVMTKVITQMGLPYDDNVDPMVNWKNIKLNFINASLSIMLVNPDLDNIADIIKVVDKALIEGDESILRRVGEGAEWFSTVMTNDHIDVPFTNRWLNKQNTRIDSGFDEYQQSLTEIYSDGDVSVLTYDKLDSMFGDTPSFQL